MPFRNPLRVSNDAAESLTIVVEPWAAEYHLLPGEECEVVAIHPDLLPTWGVSPSALGGLLVWINEGGSTFEFWRDGIIEESMPIPIPR